MSTFTVQDLGTAKDLNSVKEIGYYQVLDAVNGPISGHLIVQVTTANVAGVNSGVQKAWDMTLGTEYIRIKSAAGWQVWSAVGAGGGGGPYDPLGAADAAVADHVAAVDPHTQYLTNARGDARYDALNAASSAVSAHVAASDPHTQYLTNARGDARYDSLGAASAGDAAHVAAADPHTQYHNNTRGDARYDALGAASAGDAAHVAAADPHTQYHNNARGDARYDGIGAASAAVAAHVADSDPHTQYVNARVAQTFTAAEAKQARANIFIPSFDVGASLGLLTNPFFEISQENGSNLLSSLAVTYPADQWFGFEDDPTAAGSIQNIANPFSGVANFKRLAASSKAIVTTAQSSFGAGTTSFVPLIQRIEGTFWQTLGFGTADARGVDFVFIIQASVTGTYAFALRNFAGTRSYVTTFSLTANTPTVVLISVPGDTGGTWVTGAVGAAVVNIGTVGGSGSSASSLNTWTASGATTHTSTTNYAATLNASVQIAYCQAFPSGVLPFTSASQITGEALQLLLDMRRPFDAELRRCQRYFSSNFPIGTVPADNTIGPRQLAAAANTNFVVTGHILFPVQMRTTPAISYFSSNQKASPAAGKWQYYDGTAWLDSTAMNAFNKDAMGFDAQVTPSPVLTLNNAYMLAGGFTANARI